MHVVGHLVNAIFLESAIVVPNGLMYREVKYIYLYKTCALCVVKRDIFYLFCAKHLFLQNIKCTVQQARLVMQILMKLVCIILTSILSSSHMVWTQG